MVLPRVLLQVGGIWAGSISFGMGRKLVSAKWGETTWAVRMFPVGGYVHLLGEGDREVPASRRGESFAVRPPWQPFHSA